MKLVIDIPEETYDEVRHYGLNLCPRDKEALEKAFKTCKPLPKDATNGDIINAIFPDALLTHEFDIDWWYTSYNRGEEE